MNIPIWVSYSIVTVLASIPFYLQIQRSGGAKGEQFDRQFRQLMWVPGLVALAFRFVTNQGFGDINWGAGPTPWLLLIAILIPLGMEILLILANLIFSLARLDPEMIFIGGGKVRVSKSVRLVLGNDLQSGFKFALNLTLTVIIGSVVMLAFSLLEEFGWRGFLQQHLIDTFGLGWGLTLVGLVWGLWHVPVVLAGYQFPEYPRLGAFVFMPIFTVAAGILAGYLYYLSGSIWVPALFNAATKISSLLAVNALGEAGTSRRVRFVWLWIWSVAAGFALVFWAFG